MITTTLAVLALAGGISSGAIPSVPNWQTDYAQAMSRASAEGKPMAVFIGRGAESFKKMLSDGTIPADAVKVLNTGYVCVYLDADTPSGKDLADRFEMQKGLVISSKGGNLQAYRQTGDIAGPELAKSLTQYAGGSVPAATLTAGGTPYSSNGNVIVGGSGSRVVYPNYQYSSPSGGYYYPQYGSYPAAYCTGFK